MDGVPSLHSYQRRVVGTLLKKKLHIKLLVIITSCLLQLKKMVALLGTPMTLRSFEAIITLTLALLPPP